MSCGTASQVTFISEAEIPLAQTLVGATLGSGDRYRMDLDSQGLLGPRDQYRAATNPNSPGPGPRPRGPRGPPSPSRPEGRPDGKG